jgi:small-conductance mechanosensitive channel
VERPIKTGDWVEVGANSGIVKRINVRSTELETFSRSTVLIPNSQLISSAVINWTHKDVSGRIEIPVKVSNVTDAASVRAVLLDVAGKHPAVMKAPAAPGVLLKDFSGNSFEFELQVAVPRALQMAQVASELRFAIDQAFRAKGIGVPG